MPIEELASSRLFNGANKQFSHMSETLNCEMRFSIYLPPEASESLPVPVLYWLSGLTCSDENFIQKAGAQRIAAELGIALVAPDTSPRGESISDNERYDLGKGAGFYVNATEEPWSQNYQMYDYVVDELPQLIEENFPVNDKRSISGHSMGGHGALIVAFNNPSRYQSVSAFSPICNPSSSPWGIRAFNEYLGSDKELWRKYDATELMQTTSAVIPALIDQGSADQFLEEQLKPEKLVAIASKKGYPLELNMRGGYDHSYYFIASFIEQHLKFHKQYL